jgi:hypothetical protein
MLESRLVVYMYNALRIRRARWVQASTLLVDDFGCIDVDRDGGRAADVAASRGPSAHDAWICARPCVVLKV